VPAPDWFDDPLWTFVDVDGSEVRVSRRDAINLLATYDVNYVSQVAVPATPPPAPPAVASAPSGNPVASAPAPVLLGAAPPRARRAERRPRERELLADNRPIVVSPANAAHRLFGEAPPPGSGRNTNYAIEAGSAPVATLNAPELSDANARVLLELSGISFGLVPSSGFAVYLDCAGRAASADPVGLIDIFGATHHNTMAGMPAGKAAQRFDVTTIVRQSPGPFTLRVEPYDLLVTKAGTPLRARADQVHIGAVRFIVVS
jgi:hypothetical protein